MAKTDKKSNDIDSVEATKSLVKPRIKDPEASRQKRLERDKITSRNARLRAKETRARMESEIELFEVQNRRLRKEFEAKKNYLLHSIQFDTGSEAERSQFQLQLAIELEERLQNFPISDADLQNCSPEEVTDDMYTEDEDDNVDFCTPDEDLRLLFPNILDEDVPVPVCALSCRSTTDDSTSLDTSSSSSCTPPPPPPPPPATSTTSTTTGTEPPTGCLVFQCRGCSRLLV